MGLMKVGGVSGSGSVQVVGQECHLGLSVFPPHGHRLPKEQAIQESEVGAAVSFMTQPQEARPPIS